MPHITWDKLKPKGNSLKIQGD